MAFIVELSNSKEGLYLFCGKIMRILGNKCDFNY